MQRAWRQGAPAPFGVPVEGRVVNDVVMVQQAFGVSLAYQDIAFRERLKALRERFPLLAELEPGGPAGSEKGRSA
ncbi:YhjR family protein [Aeromonas sp. FDAARGOS 1409]|uniref:cellulose biosynthesis protein BcsR n=1 Tax=Aeromonas TaxID=642 RepID=UPI001C237B59|nr:cellulose biosynthesis protein BcsR [Aeromonas sp. FDAARGOS 1409]QXC31927.1 YhjR family protein [Aeromonas sp. FDAARGOS 1409]